MTRYFCLLLVFISCGYLPSIAQSPNHEHPVDYHDSATIMRFFDSAARYEETHTDSADYYYHKAETLASQQHDNGLLHLCYSRYIPLLNKQSRFEEALETALQHIKTGEALEDNHILMLAYNEAANEYEYLSDYQPATDYYIKALDLAIATGDRTMRQKINNNLASVFLFLKDYVNGYNYSSEAYRIAKEQHDTVTMANCLINLGVAELHQRKYDQALLHFRESERYGHVIPDMSLVADALSDEGLVYYTEHKLKEAENAYLKDKRLCDKYHLRYQKLYAFFQLALIAKEKKQYTTATADALKAVAIGEQLGTADELMEMYDTLSVLKETTGELKEALYYRKKYEGINDSLLNAQIQTNVHHLTIQFRSAQKDKQIAEQNLKIEKNRAEIETKNTWLFIFLGGIIALAAILILSLRTYYNKQKLHKQILLTLQKQHEVNTLKAKMQAREEERDRIAGEMHDDIGSALTTILYLSDDLRIQSGETALHSADKIGRTASAVVDKMNEIIWSMNSEYDTLDDLIAYTRQHAVEYLEYHGLTYCLDIPDQVPALHLSGEQRRNIYLVIKESLHNIVKHAFATSVDISFRIGDDLRITIHDNGKGIDEENLDRFGNGLKNMRKRMENIGGTFSISRDAGTTTVLLCPFHNSL